MKCLPRNCLVFVTLMKMFTCCTCNAQCVASSLFPSDKKWLTLKFLRAFWTKKTKRHFWRSSFRSSDLCICWWFWLQIVDHAFCFVLVADVNHSCLNNVNSWGLTYADELNNIWKRDSAVATYFYMYFGFFSLWFYKPAAWKDKK